MRVAAGRLTRLDPLKSPAVFSADSALLGAIGAGSQPRLWYATTGQPAGTLGYQVPRPAAVAFRPGGHEFVTVDAERNGYRTGTAGGPSSIHTLDLPASIAAAQWSPAGDILALIDASDNLCLWDLDPQHRPVPVGTVVSIPPKLTFSTNGDRVMWYDASSGVRLLDLRGGQYLPVDLPWQPWAEASPDLRVIAAVAGDRDRVRLWSVDRHRYTTRLDYGNHGIAFSPDGRTLATIGWSERLRLWDLPPG